MSVKDRRTNATDDGAERVLTRRRILHTLGLSIAVVPLAHFLGCASDDGTSATGEDDSDGGGNGGTSGDDASGSTGTDAGSTSTSDGGSWATGGTASMSGDYPDPFANGLGSACALTCAAILGPCYAETLERKDISEGHDGLPTRFAFVIVDESCKPIEGASVDLWHCGPAGTYSGSDANASCTQNDAEALAARWFRGIQTTDANGRVDFDSCFPGWYSGRTIHIHFTIRVNGTEYVTSQFVFDDALCDDIVATQPLYDTRGSRDTNNTDDTVIGASAASEYSMQTERMADGALLAWKAIVLRSSTATSLCNIPGGTVGNGGGGPGGGPGGTPPSM